VVPVASDLSTKEIQEVADEVREIGFDRLADWLEDGVEQSISEEVRADA